MLILITSSALSILFAYVIIFIPNKPIYIKKYYEYIIIIIILIYIYNTNYIVIEQHNINEYKIIEENIYTYNIKNILMIIILLCAILAISYIILR